MLKKLINKRIEVFKKLFPDYQTSKNGNLYGRINPGTSTLRVNYHPFSVTKGTYNKLGSTDEYEQQTQDALVLIKPETGLQLIKHHRRKNFKRITIKDVGSFPILAEFFFIGRKFDYLKSYRNLWPYPLASNFKSLKEFKSFMGFDFISDGEFYGLFDPNKAYAFNIMAFAEYKPNAIRLLNHPNQDKVAMLFRDYQFLCDKHNRPVRVPGGLNALKDYHDMLVHEINIEKLNKADKNVYTSIKRIESDDAPFFLDGWDMRGVKYRRLGSEYDMLSQGFKQSHCIGTNFVSNLNIQSFFTITYEGLDYEIQIHRYGQVGQFYGRNNTQPPKELRALVCDDLSFEHDIVSKTGEPAPSPLVVSNDFFDDLPF